MNCKNFGAYVKRNRYMQGLSTADAARQIGISEMQLHNIEKGKHYPQPATFIKIINALGLDNREAISILEDEKVDTADEGELQD